MGYNSIFWLPICAALTALGLVLTYRYGRNRGNRAMLRGAAWSLIPIAAYLTGSVQMFWKIADAIGNFATGFAFSPVKWAGIAVAGLVALLFLSTGGRERRKAARLKAAERAEQKKAARAERDKAATPAPGTAIEATPPVDTTTLPVRRKPEPAGAAQPAPAKRQGKVAAAVDDDLRDIEEILRKRGI
jgi:hypothetical protein